MVGKLTKVCLKASLPAESGFFMENIQAILKNKKFTKSPSQRHLAHEWQAFAYKTWRDYSGDPKELKNVMKLFSRYQATHRNFLDTAYNFCTDYMGPVPKLKLFYWKFWQLKKNASPTTEASAA